VDGKKLFEIHSSAEGDKNILILTTLAGVGEAKGKKAKEVAKKLTQQEAAAIKQETKVKYAAVLLLEDVPFVTIVPAPKLAKLNPTKLCAYAADKFPRILAVPELAICVPTVTDVKAIADALFPLAIQDGRKMSDSDKTTRKNLTKKLRTQFLLMMNSCAILSNGNLALFQLSNVAAKGSPVKHNKKLDAPVFKFDTKKGGGNMGIVCDKPVPFANDYTVYWGKGEYDKATWNSQNGGSRQLITGLNPGELYNFIMVANSKVTGPGFWSSPQSKNVPFD